MAKNTGNYLTQHDKEKYLRQSAKAIWLTGLSGSGKTTIAVGLEKKLAEAGNIARVLDGDILRDGINKDLGFSETDRYENIRRIAEINKLFNQCGIITINAFISPTHAIRELARQIIGEGSFIEIYVDASLEECVRRDPKGLYRKALAGELKDFTGVDAPYQPPLNPDIIIDTEKTTEEESIENAFKFIEGRVKFKGFGI